MNKKQRIMWITASIFLVIALAVAPSVAIIDKPVAESQNVLFTTWNDKVVTLGHVAYAAGTVDYTFDGVDDDVQFQAALDALPATGGRLVCVSATTINFSAPVSRAIDNVIVEGAGDGTYFTNDGVTAIFDAGTQSGWVFRNFRTDAGFIDVASTSDYIIENVTNDTAIVGKSVRTATFVVAASDASESAKAQADYLCDGTADNVEIQAADTVAAATGGVIQLTEGTFAIGGSYTPSSNITVQGQGESTILEIGGVVGDYDAVSGSSGGGGGTAFVVISGISHFIIKDAYLEITSDFPDYGVGSDFMMIHADSTSSFLTFENLHLIANSASGNATYGIWGSADDVKITDCIEEYCARGFNASRDHAGGVAERWTLTRCQALHDPDQVPLTTSGFEFEDGVSEIIAVDCYANDIEFHGAFSGRAFAGGVHADYAPALNEHIKIIRPRIVDCEFGFWASMTTDYLIEDSYIYSASRPIYTGTDFTTPIYQLKIIGGDWDGCGYPLVFCSDLVCDGITVRNGAEQQGLYFNGSGNPATVDNFVITNVILDAAGTDRGLRLADVNGARISNIVSTGANYAITLGGTYIDNVTIDHSDLSGNAWGVLQINATTRGTIISDFNTPHDGDAITNIMKDGNYIIVPLNAQWTASNVNGSLSQNPMFLVATTSVTASSRGMGYTYTFGMSKAGSNYDFLDWDKKLCIVATVGRRNVTGADAQIVGRFQLKQAATEGALAAKGIGIRIDAYDLYGESYGTALGAVNLGVTMTNQEQYKIAIVHDPDVPRVDWYVNGALVGTQTTANTMPTGMSTAAVAWVSSIINGVGGGVDGRLYISNLQIWQGE